MSYIFAPGATSKSVEVQIVDDAGLPVTGLNAASFPATYYWICGANAAVQITLADLATITTAYASGGLKEIDATNLKGYYRLDVPNAVLASAGEVKIGGEATNKRLICEVIKVLISLPDALPTDVGGSRDVYRVGGTVQTAGDLYSYLTTNLGALGANLSAIPKTGFKLASDGLAAVVSWTVAITGNITGNLSGSVGSVTGAVGSVSGNVGGNVTGSVGSVVGAVGSVTGLTASNLDATISSRMATYTQPAGFLAATFPSDPADQSLIIAATDALLAAINALNNLSSAQAQTAAAAALAAYDGPTHAEMTAELATADDATLAAIAALPTAAAIVTAIRAYSVETGLTFDQTMKLIAAAVGGDVTDAGTANEAISAAGLPGTPRIATNGDEQGNRSPTLTLT